MKSLKESEVLVQYIFLYLDNLFQYDPTIYELDLHSLTFCFRKFARWILDYSSEWWMISYYDLNISAENH